VIVDYVDDGHVDDSDAATIDYDQLLQGMRADALRNNEVRKAQQLSTVELVGWAEPPHYDSTTRKIYWAKQLAFSGADEHTVNYAVRVLGREGMLELNAVAALSQLAQVKDGMTRVLGYSEFTTGNRYTDYQHGRDRSAGYGIAAVVGGGVAIKAIGSKGFLAVLLGAKKLLLVLLVGIGAAAKALWGRLTGRREDPADET